MHYSIGREEADGGTGHGGNIHLLEREHKDKGQKILDFSANINPLGPPSWLRQVVSRELDKIIHYPDPQCFELINAIAKQYAIAKEMVIAANGTTELLYLLPRVINCDRAIIPVPSYIDYMKVMELNNIEVVTIPLRPENNFQLKTEEVRNVIRAKDIVILGSPNNPTAGVVAAEKILSLSSDYPESYFLIDEAFHDFLENEASVAGRRNNIITLNSLTKFFAIPGLRLGFGVFPPDLAEKMRQYLPPWTVNSIAQAVGARLFNDLDYRRETIKILSLLRKDLHNQLSCFPDLKVFPSTVNYFLVRIEKGMSARQLATELLKKNIAIRVCENYHGLDESYFRVAVRTEAENNVLILALGTVFPMHGISTMRKSTAKRKRALMIQGTSSNAGKSVIVAALCRILLQDGIRVAPFKAQNMSLNSYVTLDGLEMGRAQVVQAQAAKLDADVRMNPVLLKPNSDIGSQVIVNGKPVGNMSVLQYLKFKDQAWSAACNSYDSLADEFDVMLLEGAGSPGEVNLKHNDIVNMNMARYAHAPVLLVGDIDRGGVYASFIGTMEVLDEWERNLVAGFLVNRFRGDASLLKTAHEYMYDHTGRYVLGTVPYIKNLGIPEEDSVSFKEGKLQKQRPECRHVEIAIINLPHISNFTDIEPFLDEPDVYLRIVNSIKDLENPRSIIIPGSKNVMADLRYLHDSGIGDAIVAKAGTYCEIVGICGGYQILGRTIFDPYSIESDHKSLAALSLLDLETTLAPQKTLVRRKGKHRISGLSIHGYEIHHGLSTGSSEPVLLFEDGTHCGTEDSRLNIWGAYLHGIFDADGFRRWFIDRLRQKAGMVPLNTIVAPYDLEFAFDNLAEKVRNSIQMDKIYSLFGF